VHHWIERETLQCIRWRFTTYEGKSLHGEIWFPMGGYGTPDPWERKISGLSGELDVFVPVIADLPWHRKLFQSFRLEKHVPYWKGLIHGSVIGFDEEGHERSIQQYREGKQHGMDCFFNPDGTFSHFISFKDGVPDGPSISCWPNGILRDADSCSNGRNGPARTWWPTGGPQRDMFFAHDKPIGKHTFWLHSNGAKSHEIEYSAAGVPTNTTLWASDGRCIGTGTYKNGQPWEGYFALIGKEHPFLGHYSGGERSDNNVEWLKPDTRN
jgi:antitoxin component YwqK of YwqJK toxin-antitoxin module